MFREKLFLSIGAIVCVCMCLSCWLAHFYVSMQKKYHEIKTIAQLFMTLHETIRGKINNSVKGKYWIQYQRFTFNGHKGKIKCTHRISMGRTLIVAVVQKSVEFKTVLLELLKNIPQSLYLVCAHLFVLLSIEPFDCGCIECRITASNQVHTVYKVFNGIRTSEMYTALWQTFKDWNFTSIFMAYSTSHFHHHESYSSG